jgi:high-affinity iron transporter
MKMILISGALLAASAGLLVPQQPAQLPDQPAIVRRVAATAQLAAQEYANGVVQGRVVAQAEVDEATLFLQESRRSAALLPPEVRSSSMASIDALLDLVRRAAPAESVSARVQTMTQSLARQLNVTLDEIPASAPSLSRGAQVYRESCAGCHGNAGRGGALARGMDPPPADLTNRSALAGQSPLDYYRRITIGVAGTAMPAFESRLSAQDRWSAAVYATLMRLPRPSGDVPTALHAFGATGRMSDAELLAALGHRDTSAAAWAQVAAVRAFQPDASANANAAVFAQVRATLDTAYSLARRGDTSASSRAFDAYMHFEQVERGVRVKNPALADQLEAAFAALRTRTAGGGATSAELTAIRRQLDAGLENAERLLGDQLSPANLFLQSLVILVREGLEALLIVGALLTFLGKMGAAHRKRDIHIGVGGAVGASLLTAVALETVFQLTPAKREALEGATMLLATLVLFYVSYWLLSKMEVAKWNHFVKSKVQDALTSGSGLALAAAAFLAVYREGFETVLFYKALFLSGGSAGSVPILGGIVVGCLAMAAVYVAINRFGLRLPLKPFFGITSAFLYYMAFVFAGKGIAELQEGGLIGTTIVPGAPRLPALGIYPTVESLTAQGILLALFVAALVWTFIVAPRRRPVRTRAAPSRARVGPPPGTQSVPQGPSLELLRSLERMEADLGEMRAEVERMKANLTEAPEARTRKS